MKRQRRKQYLKLLVLLAVVAAVGLALIWRRPVSAPAAKTTNSTTATTQTQQPAAFDKTTYSLTDPTSPWVIVNKRRPLPNGYAPADLVTPNIALRLGSGADEMKLRQVTATAMEQMFAAAKADGYSLLVASGYRSQASQKALHDLYVAQKGAVAADTDSARAGFSEHQTGLAVDVGRSDHRCEVDPCFATTPEGTWLAANAYKFGFVIRYPQNKQAITGYIYEPWHVRYVGQGLAKQIHDSNQTLEEFFGLPAAPDYQ